MQIVWSVTFLSSSMHARVHVIVQVYASSFSPFQQTNSHTFRRTKTIYNNILYYVRPVFYIIYSYIQDVYRPRDSYFPFLGLVINGEINYSFYIASKLISCTGEYFHDGIFVKKKTTVRTLCLYLYAVFFFYRRGSHDVQRI